MEHPILTEVNYLITTRGEEYDKGKERSFAKVAVCFTEITGKHITPAEVALLLGILKDVRQWTDPSRFHRDSALDSVAYHTLKVEELLDQYGE